MKHLSGLSPSNPRLLVTTFVKPSDLYNLITLWFSRLFSGRLDMIITMILFFLHLRSTYLSTKVVIWQQLEL